MEQITLELDQYSPTAMQLSHQHFQVVVDRPVEKGGGGQGLMGGQHLLIGIGGCFCSTFFAAAQSRGLEVEGLKVKVVASMSDNLPKRFEAVTLEVTCSRNSDPKLFQKILKIAENGCLSVNTVKNGLDFAVTAS